jgi:hypothetical protein
MEIEELTIRDLEKFVAVYQRNARLRVHPGMDVRVGSYVPPKGGEHIREMLRALLDDINGERIDAWNARIQYESIHPFTDGNGRSGRVIYHWQMRDTRMADLGFLHASYYQTLRNCQTPPKNPSDLDMAGTHVEKFLYEAEGADARVIYARQCPGLALVRNSLIGAAIRSHRSCADSYEPWPPIPTTVVGSPPCLLQLTPKSEWLN